MTNQLVKKAISHFQGVVMKGNQIGRTIGFPTANIQVQSDLYFPALNGVYSVLIYIQKKPYHGVMNIGVKPTFDSIEHNKTFEVHILDFDEDIYYETVEVEIIHFIRQEKKFENVAALIAQIKKDCVLAQQQICSRKERTEFQARSVTSAIIHSPDLEFSKYCEREFGINRGIYNTIDKWLAEHFTTHIIQRRTAIIQFLNWVSVYIPKEKKVIFGSKGLTEQLFNFKENLIQKTMA